MNRRHFFTIPAALLLATSLAACTTTGRHNDGTAAGKRQEINTGATAALERLYDTVPGARDLSRDAKGILVFPSVLSAGLVVGGEYGNGELRVGNQTEGYYNISSASVGLQAGAQSKAMIFMFMTEEALNKFRNSKGWTAGADASVAVAKVGANGTLDTNTAGQSVVAFVMTNAGLMANLSVEGTKITKINL